jgi:hypothetical protein
MEAGKVPESLGFRRDVRVEGKQSCRLAVWRQELRFRNVWRPFRALFAIWTFKQ